MWCKGAICAGKTELLMLFLYKWMSTVNWGLVTSFYVGNLHQYGPRNVLPIEVIWYLFQGNVYLDAQGINPQVMLENYIFEITATLPGRKESIELFHQFVNTEMIIRTLQIYLLGTFSKSLCKTIHAYQGYI